MAGGRHGCGMGTAWARLGHGMLCVDRPLVAPDVVVRYLGCIVFIIFILKPRKEVHRVVGITALRLQLSASIRLNLQSCFSASINCMSLAKVMAWLPLYCEGKMDG